MRKPILHSNDLDGILRLAKEAAAKGASFHQKRPAKDITINTKSSELDLVSETDLITEKVIVEYISKNRPEDSIISEEGNNHEGDSGINWIIDPLDGTVNYLHGFPAFGISIGVEVEGIGVVGVVCDTYQNQIYSGIIDRQATRDGEQIFASDCSALQNALIATGFLPNPGIRTIQGRILTDILPNVLDVRRSGSPTIDLCRVASGAIDGFYEFGLEKWDVSAGSTIAQAAGAKVTIVPINHKTVNSLTVASTVSIHSALLEAALESWERHS